MMGFLKKWFGKWFAGKKKTGALQEPEEEQAGSILRRDSVNLYDAEERMGFVRSCLEQMRDAQEQIENLTREYGMVTSCLTDMEEINALPAAEKREISVVAETIAACEREKNNYEAMSDRMPESEFRRVERMEDEVEEGIKKLKSAEEYQDKIRQDMRRLDGEKHAYQYRRHDLHGTMVNMRGMIIITGFAFVTCMVILLLLQVLMDMDIGIGYILTTSATAFAVFAIYMKYAEAAREKKQVERDFNRLILLHNRVKIRYVNNTNLLDYLYMKYKVSSAAELVRLWERYEKELEEREKFKKLYADLDFHRRELLRLLRRFRVKDPEMWLHQAQALINHNEMVEIRHGLIQRRQRLRKQMEYNERLAEDAQAEIKSLVEEFPIFAPEIMEMVSQYEESEAS